MPDGKLGAVEARFADLVWENAPIASRELARLCEQELGWKRIAQALRPGIIFQ